jgi:hypothetical protein
MHGFGLIYFQPPIGVPFFHEGEVILKMVGGNNRVIIY